MKEFAHQIVIVTGAASGIGRETAFLFAERGASVVVVDLRQPAVEVTAAEIVHSGGSAWGAACDVSNPESVRALMEQVVDREGGINVLVNNAGMIMPGFIEDISDDDWRRVVDVNLSSVFYTSKYAMPELKKRRGAIVNMASMNGLVGQMKNPAYSATKGGVIALTRSVAIDAAPFGVRVNAVCPAGVLTPLLEDWFNQQPNPTIMREYTDLSHMLGRTATPREIAELILFLASDRASFITGQAIPIEGGATLGYGVGPKAEWTVGVFERPKAGEGQ
ncbi:MAG: SDR family NAD(P)-dependent oxidoreductase [Firmicutes bacterium]|nr:SDR family NAD(P)-dependent oxidoreductase [Bacillota bacterium]